MTEIRGGAALRPDLQLIADMVAPGSRVLDIGCGDGMLLEYLWRRKGVDGRGIELGQGGVNACVGRGLSVIQGDADTDLKDYPSDAFDFAILSQTLQATRDPLGVVRQLVRIARHAIVSFPNFGHWRVRLYLALRGRMPVTRDLPQPWHSTPNIHLCTIRDFEEMCAAEGIAIERRIAPRRGHEALPSRVPPALANLMNSECLFLLKRK